MDFPIWRKYAIGRIPDDFHAFLELTQGKLADAFLLLSRGRKKDAFLVFKNWISRKKMRVLVSAVPARATHAEIEWLAPAIDWPR